MKSQRSRVAEQVCMTHSLLVSAPKTCLKLAGFDKNLTLMMVTSHDLLV